MVQPQIPNAVQRILVIASVFIFMSAVTVLFVGHTVSTLHKDIKVLQAFLVDAKDLQPNFEQSLVAYTTTTQPVIDYLLALRPDSEADYIAFIGAIEAIEQKLLIKVNLESITTLATQSTLDYNIDFYGNAETLDAFLRELESLPYYIKVSELHYTDPSLLIGNEATDTNISMKIQLFIK